MATVKRRPERGNRWQATYRGPDGKERARLFERKADAERWVAQAQADLSRGTYVDPAAGKITLADYGDAWLARMAPTWRPSSIGHATSNIKNHVVPVLGARPLASLRRGDVEALYASLALAPSTVGLIHRHLRQMLASAVDDGVIVSNPAARARLPRVEDSRAQPIPLEVVARIAANLPERLAVAVPLGVGVGLRRSEAMGLTVGRIDFLRRTLRVDRQLDNVVGGVPSFSSVKTRRSNRTVPLAGFVLEALADHLRRFPAGPDDVLLRTDDGRPISPRLFSTYWRQACVKAGAPDVRYHDTRHTFASTLLSRGVSVKAVADWLGHASPVITLTTYAHLMPADEEVARAVLDAALMPSADQARTTAAAHRV